MVVLDTHALVWWTLDPDQLSLSAKQHCDVIASSGAIVSSISLWEIGIKVKRGHLDLGIDFDDYVRRLQFLKGLQIVPVEVEHWVENLKLQWDHRDPADRTIVATAKRYDLPLISKDDVVRAFYAKTICGDGRYGAPSGSPSSNRADGHGSNQGNPRFPRPARRSRHTLTRAPHRMDHQPHPAGRQVHIDRQLHALARPSSRSLARHAT